MRNVPTPRRTYDSRPSVDLVLLSWNHLEETQPCLESLFAHTRVPCRLIIVDNGSEPAVRAALATVAPRGAVVDVRLVQNERNEGFPRGMNRGLALSTAPFACLLNNDLRMTPGWLEEMLAVATAHPEVGLINPASNTFGQRPPRGMSIERYAHTLRARHGEYSEVGMCIGFCVLIKREVLDRIGPLSEEVERCFFEDEDFSMRAVQAGFRCVVAEGAYVHHAEHQTVRWVPEREALFARNRRWCEQRWGRRLRIAWPCFDELRPGSAALRARLEQWLGWARRRAFVYVFCPLPKELTVAGLFASVGLARHADIHWRAVPRRGAGWAAAGCILKRRKKPFDAIVAADARWGKMMRRMFWLHRAAVVSELSEDVLTALRGTPGGAGHG